MVLPDLFLDFQFELQLGKASESPLRFLRRDVELLCWPALLHHGALSHLLLSELQIGRGAVSRLQGFRHERGSLPVSNCSLFLAFLPQDLGLRVDDLQMHLVIYAHRFHIFCLQVGTQLLRLVTVFKELGRELFHPETREPFGHTPL